MVAVLVALALIAGTAQAAVAAPRPKAQRGFVLTGGSVVEGDAGSRQLVFTVTLQGSVSRTATVRYAVNPSTATPPADYSPTSGLLTFPKGVTQRQFGVTVFGDLIDEADEVFVASLSRATRTKILTAQANGTITDDDPAPVVRVSAASVLEGETGATSVLAFPVGLDRASGRTVSVRFSTSNGTATAGTDYQPVSNQLVTFEPGQSTVVVPVTVIGDGAEEGVETMVATLSAPQNAVLATTTTATGTIIDNDPLTTPTVTIADRTNAEGATFTFPIAIQPVSATPFQLRYDVVASTADTPADLPGVAGGTITVPANAGLVNLDLATTEDALNEPSEDFFVNLQLGTPTGGASIADGQAVGTITDDDPAPTVSTGATEVSEGDTTDSPNFAFFPVTLGAASGRTVTVAYATGGGTAVSGTDYTATSGTLSFPPGTTDQTVAVPILGNLVDNPDTTFELTLSSPENATLGTATGTGTILDDEAADTVVIGVDDPTVTEGDTSAVLLPFTVQLNDFSDDQVTVHYAVTGPGTGLPSGTLAFESGETAAVVPVSVPGDTAVTGNHLYTLTLSVPSANAALGKATGTGTVVDNDIASPPNQVSVGDATVVEGDDAPTVLQFVLTLAQPAAGPLSVDFSTAGLTAMPNDDFLPAGGQLNFVTGQQSKVVLVVVQPDLETEPTEQLLVDLTNPSAGLAIADGQAMGTIADDDPAAGVTISIGDDVVREASPSVIAHFAVTLSAPAPTGGVTYGWSTAPDTATAGDFTATSGTATIPAGAQSAVIPVTVLGDTTDDPITERFVVDLTTSTPGVTLGRSQGVGTIIDNEGLLPQVSLGEVTVHNGTTPGTVVITVPVTLDQPSTGTVTIDYSIPSPTGGAPIEGTITIPAGQTSGSDTQTVPGTLQQVAASTLTITDATGALLVPGAASGTPVILPVVSIDEVVVNHGPDPGTSIVEVTVSLDEPSDEDVTVVVTIPPATSGGAPTTITIVVPAGATTGQGQAIVPGEPEDVAANPVTVTLPDGGGVVSPTEGSAHPVVIDLPVVSIDSVVVNPGTTPGTSIVEVTVSLEHPSDVDVTVEFTVPGSPPVVGTIVIPAGSTTASGSVEVPGAPASVAGSNVTLTDASGAVIDPSDSSQPPTVVNLPVVSIDDVVVNDGPTPGTSIVVVTATLTQPATTPVTVEYTIPPAVPGGDPTTGTITIPAGSSSGTGSVVVPGAPSAVAAGEVGLTGATGAVLDPSGSSQAPAVVDLPIVHLGDVVVTDSGTAGTVVVVIPVTIDEPSSVPVTVTYSIPSTTGGAPTTGTITFPPGSTSQTVQVPVPGTTGQVAAQPVTLTGVTNGVLDPGDLSANPAVVDLPVVTIGDVTVSPGPQPGTVVLIIPITLDQPAAVPVTVDYSVPSPSGGAPITGTITIPAGSTSGIATVTVPGNTTTQVPGPVTITSSTSSVVNPSDRTDAASASAPAGGAAPVGAVDRFTRVATGYRMVASDGGIFTFGDAPFFGSTGDIRLNQPIVGMATTPSGDGYWLVASDGGIFAFGDAEFYGSTGNLKLNKPIVGMETTPTGKGYWLVATDGGIFAFGDAEFLGSTGAIRLNQPIVGMETTPSGDGYWLAARDGGIFSFGDAGFHGSTGAIRLNQPIVGMAASPSGQGYRLVATDGGIFAFGDASFLGSTGDIKLNKPIVGMAVTPSGNGYWLAATDGGIFTFGDAQFLGSTGDLRLNQPVNGMAPVIRTIRAG